MKNLLLIFIAFIFSCSKPNVAQPTPPIQTPGTSTTGGTSKAIDYSKFMPVRNITAYSSYIDSISISDTMYHPFHTDSLFYMLGLNNKIFWVENNYYNVPTKGNCKVKFYLTVGDEYTPIEITIFQPDGSYLESTEVLKYVGKDSATFKMPISNKIQVDLSHI